MYAKINKKLNVILGIFLLIFSFSSICIFAQEKEIEEMSLEELLNVEITSVSKKAEKVGESPGIISIITAKRLKELGITNLLDALSYIPGISVMETYWREPIVTVRGVMESLYNDKILLLINGLPAFEAVNGSSYFESIPIDGVERIEVIRGPGSVLYGTNAFAGVINVVMKTGEAQNGLTTNFSGGNFNRKSILATYGKKNKDTDYLLSFTYSDDDGYPKVFDYDEATTTFALKDTYTYQYKNELFNIYGSIAHKGLKFFGSYWSQTQNKFGMVPILGYGGAAEHTGADIGLKFDNKFSDKLSYSASGRFTYMKRYNRVGYNQKPTGWGQGFYNAFGDYSLYKGSVFTLDNYITSSIRDNLNLIMGASYEKYLPKNLYTVFKDGGLNLQGSTPFPPPEAENWAAYLQTDYSYNIYKLIGGVRYSDFGKEVGTSVTPRFGVLVDYSKNTKIRVLYGDAFRAPSVYERFVSVPRVLNGTPKLNPEKINTIEASIDYNIGGKILAKATIFNSRIKDLIVRIPLTSTPTWMQYTNSSDKQVISGYELELEGKLSENISLFMNFSYKDADNKKTNSPVFYVEKYLANLGLTFSPTPKLSISPNIQYVGRRNGVLAATKAWVGTAGDPVEIHSYALVNLDLNYKTTKESSVYLGIKNIMNEKYKFPEHVRRNIDAIPGGPGRSFYIGLEYNMK